MIEVYKQVAAGKFSLNDSIPVKNEFKSIVDGSIYTLDREADSESELYDQIGKKKTVAGLVQAMIVVSSNLATNIIIELVGAENANQTMRSTGTKKMRVLRGVEDSKAFEKNLNNVTTASDLMVVFEKIARGEIVSPEACGAMIAVLSDQHFNEIIPKKLPPGVKVAHKTGNITGVQHDSGIIFLPDGRKYVLVLLSKDLEDEKSAIAAMADVSRLVYDHMTLRDRR
jgi:beta-lactamase class A